MIKELLNSIGTEKVFVLDANTFVDSKNSQFTSNLLWNGSRLKYLGQEQIDREMLKVAECMYLLNASKTIIVSEIREELRELSNLVKDRVKRIKSLRGFPHFRDEERAKLQGVEEYQMAFEELRQQIYGLDPREKEFRLEDALKIDRNCDQYREILFKSEEKLSEILRERGKIKDGESARLTDAKMFAVAYLLSKRGNDVCILSRDIDVRELATRIEKGTTLERMHSNNSVSLVYNPKTNYQMRIFNSHAAELQS